MLYIVETAALYFTSFDSLAHCFGLSAPTSLPPPSTPHFFSFQIWILCQNSLTTELKIRVVGFKIRVVGFVLKKLLTYFEMVIVSHASHCVFMPLPFKNGGVGYIVSPLYVCMSCTSSTSRILVSVHYLLKRLVYWIHILYTGI